MRYGLATALGASIVFSAQPALARDTSYRIDIGAGDAAEALAALSAQTGISFASDGPLPRRAVRAVRGKMSVDEALARILEGLDLRAVRVAPRAYRIVRRKGGGRPAAAPDPAPSPVEDIVITGRKQSEKLSGVAAAVAVYVPGSDGRSGVATTTRDVARATDGVTLSNNGPGRDRLFIRGVADSPFNGLSQSAVSVQLDDTRVTFDAPEPGLRLVDVARVEILKGPQGPLYGTGALGGVYRIVTNRPLLDRVEGEAGIGASSVQGGGIGLQAEGVVNLPLIADRAAVRITGYAATDPGWIDDVDGRRDLNRLVTRGGRVALRVAPFGRWTIDLSAMQQTIHARDSQYVDRPGGWLRDVPISEPRAGRVQVFQGTIAGSIGSLRLTLSSGLTKQDDTDTYDASASAAALGVAAPATYLGWSDYHVYDQEIRIGSAPDSRIRWVVGASFLLSRTMTVAFLPRDDGSIQIPNTLLQEQRRVTETALFADGSLPLTTRLRLGIGLRGFRAGVRNDNYGYDHLTTRAETLFGITPSASLSYDIASDQLLYARFATAFRPGGLDSNNAATRRYDADEVRGLDLGGRVRVAHGRLDLDGAVFRTAWSNIQADYLQTNGLVATHNAGRATVVGAELSADWRPAGGWRVQAGAIWQHPRLVRAADGGALPQDGRLPIVSDVSARLTLAREVGLYGWRVTPSLAANLTGATRLSLDTDLARRMPAYVVGRFGVTADRDRLTLRLDIDNLLDASADTFAFGNPFSVRSIRQYTPPRPRTFSLSASRRF